MSSEIVVAWQGPGNVIKWPSLVGVIRVCPCCKGDFEPGAPNQVFCCPHCKNDRVSRRGPNLRYLRSDKGRRAHLRYLCSPKGRAMLQRRKDRLGELFWDHWKDVRKYVIFVEERPCAVCGEDDKSLLECDHVIPKAAGGTNAIHNVQVLCHEHHRYKTDQDLILMRPFPGTLTVGAYSTLT